MTNADRKIYLEGNATSLAEYLQLVCGKPDIKICYVGSHIANDILATAEINEPLQKNEKFA